MADRRRCLTHHRVGLGPRGAHHDSREEVIDEQKEMNEGFLSEKRHFGVVTVPINTSQ